MSPPECSEPRMRNATATRTKILQAARKCFAANSYDNVGLREIASGAGVDPALICRYFGGKEALFAEALRLSSRNDFLQGVTLETLPNYLAEIVTSRRDDEAERIEWLKIVLHSASSTQAARLVHETLDEEVIQPVISMLSNANCALRASLLLSILMGQAVLATMGSEHLRETGDGPLRQKLRDLFAEAIR